MKPAARTVGAANGRLLLTVVVFSLAPLRLALANGDDLQLPAILAELKDRGYPRHGGRAVFLGDAGPWLQFLQQNHVAPISAGELRAIPDESVVLVIAHGAGGVDFGLVDRVLKVGGVAAIFATSRSPPQLPDNYKVVAFAPRSEKNEGAVAFAAEKTGALTASAAIARRHHRKLLAVPGNREDVLDGLEGVLLEPPQRRHAIRRLRPKYLPELTGDSLEGYRRRVFIDVAPAPGGGAASWFMKHYPRRRHEFESVRLTAAGEAAEGIGDWLEGNVGEEDYVVVKAGVEAAEEMLRKGAAVVRRVDELFLDCGEGGGEGAAGSSNSGRRPYWQCLVLYGRLRDQGVAVHQWWSGMLK